MIRFIFLLINFSLVFSLESFAQSKEDYMWLGGYQRNLTGAGAQGFTFNFNKKPPIVEKYFPPNGFDSNNAIICDHSGKLLFSTNGRYIVNIENKVMPNGDDINIGEWAIKYWPDGFFGFPGFQDIIILPDPGKSTGYYVIHKATYIKNDSIEIRNSYVNVALDGGKGDVVYKNQYFYGKRDLMYSYLTAIRHANQRDWWVLQPLVNKSEIAVWLIDETGFHQYPSQSSSYFFDMYRSSASGTAKFSSDGSKYAIYNYYDQLQLYDFDRSTGKLSNHKRISIIPDLMIDRELYVFSSIEWSPNSRFIYTATDTYLHQIDTWDSNAIRLIDTYNGTLDPFSTRFFLMAQAPDCKIYMTPKNGSNSIHVINKPDELGTACDFVQNGIKLPHPNGGSLPNFPRFRVDEVDKCDPSISSIFGEQVYYRRDLHVYPNPCKNYIDITLPESNYSGHFAITDMHGNMIKSWLVNNDYLSDRIDLTLLPSGRYNIEFYPDNEPNRIFYSAQIIKVE